MEKIFIVIGGYALVGLIIAVFLVPVIYSIKSNAKDNDPEAHRKRVRDAIDKITADGKVEGPKGPYVPHKKYSRETDHETSGPKHGGRYNHPWQ
jgi:hypothetical protein